jgi:N-acetyl-alpha-D-glucosaminyl L-malate synthase BshA
LNILHAHYALPHAVSGYLARAAAQAERRRPAPKLVCTLHGTDITLVGSDPSYAPLTSFVLQACDAVTAVSQWLARMTCENLLPCEGQLPAVEVVPNFVDTERFTPQAACAGTLFRGDVPTAVHVSNFRPVKRVPWLVEAFAEATSKRQARLVLVGDGPDRAACHGLATKLGIASKVVFLGERDALPELLAPARVFALSSDQESFGLSALEAMACGTAVVSTDAGGVREVVSHGVTGLLSPPGDRSAFAANLAALLFDENRAMSMGRDARTAALERFQRGPVVAAYERIYYRVLGR